MNILIGIVLAILISMLFILLIANISMHVNHSNILVIRKHSPLYKFIYAISWLKSLIGYLIIASNHEIIKDIKNRRLLKMIAPDIKDYSLCNFYWTTLLFPMYLPLLVIIAISGVIGSFVGFVIAFPFVAIAYYINKAYKYIFTKPKPLSSDKKSKKDKMKEDIKDCLYSRITSPYANFYKILGLLDEVIDISNNLNANFSKLTKKKKEEELMKLELSMTIRFHIIIFSYPMFSVKNYPIFHEALKEFRIEYINEHKIKYYFLTLKKRVCPIIKIEEK